MQDYFARSIPRTFRYGIDPQGGRYPRMKATASLRDLGQSLWLDNITRDLLNDGTLARYIEDFSITGLTSNPTIFNHAIKGSQAYEEAILKGLRAGLHDEALFFALAL